MAETLEIRGSVPKWHPDNISKDLEKQGGLPGVLIDILSINEHGCAGDTLQGTRFYITWIKDVFLLVSMSQEEPKLIEAFARIVEYRPFCRYEGKTDNGTSVITYEWDKKDPNGRYVELQEEGKKNLQRVN